MNPYNYLQYQSKAEPLREIYPNQLDKWEPRLSQPQPRCPFPTAILVSACSFVPLVSEAVTLDKWYRQASEPVRTAAPLRIHETILNPQILREGPITIDKWWQPTQQPYLRVKRPIDEGGNVFFNWEPLKAAAGPEQYPDRWWQPASIPVWGKPPLRIYEPVQNPQILREGPITLDKWFQPTQQPYLTVRRPVAEGGSFFFNWEPLKAAAGPEQYPDRWWQPTSTPVWTRPPLRIYEPVQNPQVLREGPISFDKWWQPPSTPIFLKPNLSFYPPLFFVSPVYKSYSYSADGGGIGGGEAAWCCIGVFIADGGAIAGGAASITAYHYGLGVMNEDAYQYIKLMFDPVNKAFRTLFVGVDSGLVDMSIDVGQIWKAVFDLDPVTGLGRMRRVT